MTLKDDTETYSFIGVDACLSLGPIRYFNFIGLLDHEDINNIQQFKNESIQQKSNYTIWFGHYPTSSITAPNPGLKDIIKCEKVSLFFN